LFWKNIGRSSAWRSAEFYCLTPFWTFIDQLFMMGRGADLPTNKTSRNNFSQKSHVYWKKKKSRHNNWTASVYLLCWEFSIFYNTLGLSAFSFLSMLVVPIIYSLCMQAKHSLNIQINIHGLCSFIWDMNFSDCLDNWRLKGHEYYEKLKISHVMDTACWIIITCAFSHVMVTACWIVIYGFSK
jgi:hypothetical protein